MAKKIMVGLVPAGKTVQNHVENHISWQWKKVAQQRPLNTDQIPIGDA